MFLLSKLIWIVLSPLNLLIIILFIGFLFQLMKIQLISRLFYLIALLFFILTGVWVAVMCGAVTILVVGAVIALPVAFPILVPGNITTSDCDIYCRLRKIR